MGQVCPLRSYLSRNHVLHLFGSFLYKLVSIKLSLLLPVTGWCYLEWGGAGVVLLTPRRIFVVVAHGLKHFLEWRLDGSCILLKHCSAG